jgi:hypothetical protein
VLYFPLSFAQEHLPNIMSLSINVGSNQLFQLGVSLSDIALILSHGRKFGNWLRVSNNDDELLGSIGEKEEALLKRRDLVEASDMERRWSRIDFIYQGQHHNNSLQAQTKEIAAGLSSFSWLMVTIVTALDLCLPSAGVQALIRRVYTRVLDREQELEDSLRILLPTNIESWRSTGCVRAITTVISRAMKTCRYNLLQEHALPQLNPAETKEMEDFLVWLLEGSSSNFKATSVIVFSAAVAIGKAGVKLRTEGERTYETEPFVYYVENHDKLGNFPFLCNLQNEFNDPFSLKRGIGSMDQQIAYPRNDSSSMIHSLPANRPTINNMIHFWDLGSKAASKMHLHAEAQLPYFKESEIYYILENLDIVKSNFGKEVLLLAGRSFPEKSESILLAIEELAKGMKGDRLEWLHQRTELGYLKRANFAPQSQVAENMGLWLQYQALVFGFYYKLMEQLVSLDLVQEDAYFRGLWGYGGTTFLAMCVEFGDIVRREGKISRSHVLYMLSTMYSGRQKSFSTLSTGRGLLGIFGSISVLSMPLLRTTDKPGEISRFMLVDLPILDLTPDLDGELFACVGGGVTFDYSPASLNTIKPRSPSKKWSLHAKMGLLFGDGMPGVVMAARCGGRLVGWFNPLAADVAFLSSAYQQRRHDKEKDYTDQFTFCGFEIEDGNWQDGRLQRPITDDPDKLIGIVHSKDCPELRYVAAGMYTEVGEEVAIATDDIEAAYGRIEGQGEGIIIA